MREGFDRHISMADKKQEITTMKSSIKLTNIHFFSYMYGIRTEWSEVVLRVLPVSTTFPETKMSRTILGLIIR